MAVTTANLSSLLFALSLPIGAATDDWGAVHLEPVATENSFWRMIFLSANGARDPLRTEPRTS